MSSIYFSIGIGEPKDQEIYDEGKEEKKNRTRKNSVN
jgi:hypothetical protein